MVNKQPINIDELSQLVKKIQELKSVQNIRLNERQESMEALALVQSRIAAVQQVINANEDEIVCLEAELKSLMVRMLHN